MADLELVVRSILSYTGKGKVGFWKKISGIHTIDLLNVNRLSSVVWVAKFNSIK